MKANNAKFGATMIARVPFRGDGSEAVLYQEQCDAYDFAVLIGFSTYENAVEYINDSRVQALSKRRCAPRDDDRTARGD